MLSGPAGAHSCRQVRDPGTVRAKDIVDIQVDGRNSSGSPLGASVLRLQLLGRLAIEFGTLYHLTGPKHGTTASGGRSCCPSSRRCP